MVNPEEPSSDFCEDAIEIVSARFADLVAQDYQGRMLDQLQAELFAQSSERDLADRLLASVQRRCGAHKLYYLGLEDNSPVRTCGYTSSLSRRPGLRSLLQWTRDGRVQPELLELLLPVDAPRQVGLVLHFQGAALALIAFDSGQGAMVDEFLERLGERAGQALFALRQRLALDAAQKALVRHQKEAQKQMHLMEDWTQILSRLEGRYQQLEDLLKATVATLGGEKGSLMLLDEQNHDLVVRAVCGLDAEVTERIRQGTHTCKRLKLGEGVAGKVAQSLQPMVVNQVDREPVFLEPQLSQVSSIVCLPLHVDGLALGVINITNRGQGKRFQAQHLEAGMKLARQASRAINQSRLYQLAVLDPVTEVYSRSHLYQRTHDELARARRYTRHLALAAITLQGLDVVRSHHSHQIGNQIEHHAAQILQDCIRETDLLARLGEYSFAVLMPETDALSAMFAAERICQRTRESEMLQHYYVTAHVGICSYPDRAESVARLVARAEQAMLTATRTTDGLPVVLAAVPSREASVDPQAVNY